MMLSSTSLRLASLRQLSTARHSVRSFSHNSLQSHLVVPSQRLAKLQPAPSTAPIAQQSASFATSADAVAPAASAPEPQEENQNFAAIATGGIPYPGIPKIEDPYQKRQWQLEHMAGAFRVFARLGFTEGAAGHISVRDTVDPDTFWINP